MSTLKLKEPSTRPELHPGYPNDEFCTQVLDQVANGLDAERLLPSREKRARELAKKLDRPMEENGWRKFVAGCVHTMLNGKAPQRRNAEVTLVETIGRWTAQVRELAPDRADRLTKIIHAGFAKPAPAPQKRN